MLPVIEWRAQGLPQEQVLERLYEAWADHEAQASYKSAYLEITPTLNTELPSWQDHEGNFSDAAELLAYSLKGGSGIGHVIDTISEDQAQQLSNEFVQFFDNPRMYRGLAWGDPDYVFENGIVLIDDNWAEMLLVVEDD